MSSRMGACAVNGSSRVGDGGNGDTNEENEHSQTPSLCSKTVRPMPRSTDPAVEGRSSNVEHLVRPALPGRKVHRKTITEESRGRCREGNQEISEEKLRTEHRERGKIREGRMDRTASYGDETRDRQGRRSTESSSSSNSDVQFNSILEVGEGSNHLQRGHTCPGPQDVGLTQTITSSINYHSHRPAVQARSTPVSPQRLSSRLAVGDLNRYSFSSSRDPDQFWMEVRTRAASGRLSQTHRSQTHIPPLTPSEAEEEEDENEGNAEDDEEEGSGVLEVMSQPMTPAVPPCIHFGERRMSKREKNRIKSLRRRQRRRERWRQSQQQESRQVQSSIGNPTTSSSSTSCTTSSSSSGDDEPLSTRNRDGLICAVCLDVYFNPYMCHPCNHIFCEPCLRTLAKNSPTNTPCPLCRTVITHVFFQKELNQTARTFFPKEYLSRKQSFQKASCAKWPLPSSRKLFRIFGGFQRQSSPIARRQFPHGGGYRLNTMDFEDDSRGWRFDMDMVIIYIYSVNWVIGFFIFCFLCYLFFPSF